MEEKCVWPNSKQYKHEIRLLYVFIAVMANTIQKMSRLVYQITLTVSKSARTTQQRTKNNPTKTNIYNFHVLKRVKIHIIQPINNRKYYYSFFCWCSCSAIHIAIFYLTAAKNEKAMEILLLILVEFCACMVCMCEKKRWRKQQQI